MSEKYGLSIMNKFQPCTTVVGIGPNGKLWRSIEGEESSEKGVWFFSERELQECKVNQTRPDRRRVPKAVDTNSVTVNKEGLHAMMGVELRKDGLYV